MTELKYDLCILGAGPAGIGAAMAARSFGARVLLVDKDGTVGGMSTVGMLNIWCGNAESSIFDRITALTTKTVPSGRRIYSPEELKPLLIELLEERGVDILLHSFANRVECEGGRIKRVLLATKSGEVAVSAKSFIDATGDGDVAALAGAEYNLGREDGRVQPMTVQFTVTGVDEKRALFANVRTPELEEKMQEYLADGRVSFPVGLLILIEAIEPNTAFVNMTNVIDVDPTNVFDLTRAEIKARKQIPQILRFLRENVPGYENCRVIASAAYAGARESRRIKCRYTLTAEDIVAGKVFEDAIVFGASYEFGIHNPKGAVSHPSDKPADSRLAYTIPYRSFTPRGFSNLTVAGRCIDGDHYALSSYRVMPICFAMGEGVGLCNAVALRDGTDPCALSKAQLAEVQSMLKEKKLPTP